MLIKYQIKNIRLTSTNYILSYSGSDTTWKQEYSFQNAFSVSDIKPASLFTHTLLMRFRQNDSTEFEEYLKYNVVSLKPEDSEYYDGLCDRQCRWKHLGAIGFIDVDPYNECINQNCPDCDVTDPTPSDAQTLQVMLPVLLLMLFTTV